MSDYFISALEIFPYPFMGAAPLHTYIGDFIKYTLHLYVPPMRDMKSIRYMFIGRDNFVGASRISKWLVIHMNFLHGISNHKG